MIIKTKSDTTILYGTDPECAAVYEKDGKLFALPPFFFRKFLDVPFVDPDADNPEKRMKHPQFFKEPEFLAIEDGANFEFTIRPSTNPKELFDRVQECAKQVSERILSKFPNYCLPELKFLPTVNWDVPRWTEMIKSRPELEWEFLMSTKFGCDPDKDVFDLSPQCDVEDVSMHPERYCGAHFHMSGSPIFRTDPDLVVKIACLTIGLSSTAFSIYPELEHARLYRYGRPGRFRVQEYGKLYEGMPYTDVGVEYRTPSATWAGNWSVAKEVFRWAEIGVKNLLETSLGVELVGEIMQPAVNAIMKTDQKLAKELLAYIEDRI